MNLYIYEWGIDPSNQPILIFAKDEDSAKEFLAETFPCIPAGTWTEARIEEGVVRAW